MSAEEQTGGKEEESDSSSEADNMPLSSLRERPVTPGQCLHWALACLILLHLCELTEDCCLIIVL